MSLPTMSTVLFANAAQLQYNAEHNKSTAG